MDSYTEVRRVRQKMSAEVGHDIRALIASINQCRPQAIFRIIGYGTKAEKSRIDGKDRTR